MKKFTEYFSEKTLHRFYLVLSGFVDLAESLVRILTLTLYYPGWSMRFTCWWAIKTLERKKRRELDERFNG